MFLTSIDLIIDCAAINKCHLKSSRHSYIILIKFHYYYMTNNTYHDKLSVLFWINYRDIQINKLSHFSTNSTQTFIFIYGFCKTTPLLVFLIKYASSNQLRQNSSGSKTVFQTSFLQTNSSFPSIPN